MLQARQKCSLPPVPVPQPVATSPRIFYASPGEQVQAAEPARLEYVSRTPGSHHSQFPNTTFREKILALADEYDGLEKKVRQLERNLMVTEPSEPSIQTGVSSIALIHGDNSYGLPGSESNNPPEKLSKELLIARTFTYDDCPVLSLANQRYERSHNPSLHVGRDIAWMVFELATELTIIANTVVLTISFNNDMKPYQNEAAPLETIETACCTFFAAELAVKLGVLRRAFFYGPHAKWFNISWWQCFDLLIVLCGLYDRVSYHLGGRRTVNLTFFRLLRFAACTPTTLFKAFKVTEYITTVRRQVQFRLVVRLVKSFKLVMPLVFILATVELYMVALALLGVLGGRLRDADPQVQREVRKHWGSLTDAMVSLYMAVTDGEQWNVLSKGLWNVSAWSYMVLFVHTAIFQFVILNVFLSIFVQIAMQSICNMDHLKIRLRAERKNEFIELLRKIFRSDIFTWAQFCEKINDADVHNLLVDLSMSEFEAMQLCHVLSEKGRKSVHVETFVVTAIMNQTGATKIDLMLNTLNIMGESAHTLEPSPPNFDPTSTICSLKYPSLQIRDLSREELLQDLKYMHRKFPQAAREQHPTFQETCAQLIDLVDSDCSGGCGFVVTPATALFELQQKFVDFQVVDRDERFPTGYMTQRLRDVHVKTQTFKNAMKEFAEHSVGDRWPDGHEARGLPKDGYMLINPAGTRVKCAVRLIGLPTPPYSWDNVGTRHLAGLAICWALREYLTAVIVRSDRGFIHVFYCWKGEVIASKLRK